MTKKQSVILERLAKNSFPMQKLYEAKKNPFYAPLADLILASDQIALQAQEPWEFKSLAQMGKEEFVRTGDFWDYDFNSWQDGAQRELAFCVVSYVLNEEKEGLLLFVQDESGKYRVAKVGDAAYDFVCRLRDEDNLLQVRFATPPKWAEELYLGRENLEAHNLIWYDNSSTSNPLYEASKKLLAEAVIRETWRRMESIPGLSRNANMMLDIVVTRGDLIDLVTLSKLSAQYYKMTNGEACDWVTTKVLEASLPVYDISGLTLPIRFESEERAKGAVCASFSVNWWCDEQLIYKQMSGWNIRASDVAISKANAIEHCLIPSELLKQDQSEFPLDKDIPDDTSVAFPVFVTRANISDKLAKMNQAAAKFWQNADRNDRGTHPDNAKVTAWLVDQGFSQTLADKAATILRPEWAPTGRKPEER